MDFSQNRPIELANFIIRNNATVRETSKYFGISKSTVHKDVSYRLPHINNPLYNKVRLILQHNLSVRHIRGGESTKNKYKASK